MPPKTDYDFEIDLLLIDNTLIPQAAFDRDKNEWLLTENSVTDIKTDALTLVTFNTWFGDYHFEKRFQAITKILKKSDADIIALQEITDASLKLILEDEWLRDNYFISDISGSTFYSYGVVLLSRFPIKKLHLHPLQSDMDRHVLIAEFVINGQKILIGNPFGKPQTFCKNAVGPAQ